MDTLHSQPSRTPKYEAVYRQIREELRAGHYYVGSRLPTERELAVRFGVSRVTVRRSLDQLVQRGFVQSRQGSGYHVISLSPAADTCLSSFTDLVTRSGRRPGAKLLSIKMLHPAGLRQAMVHPDLLSQEVGVITRVRTIDDTPVFLIRTYLQAKHIESATPDDFPEAGPNQSILRILRRRFRVNWCAATETIRALPADEEVAGALGIEVGTPVLLQSCTAADETGRVVFHDIAFRHGQLAIEHPSFVREAEEGPNPPGTRAAAR